MWESESEDKDFRLIHLPSIEPVGGQKGGWGRKFPLTQCHIQKIGLECSRLRSSASQRGRTSPGTFLWYPTSQRQDCVCVSVCV